MPKHIAPQIDFDSEDFPQSITKEDREKAMSLIHLDLDPSTTLEQKLNIQHDNSAMLGDDPKKSLTTADRIRTLFQQQGFSPLTRLVRLVKVEEAKLEAYNRAVSYGLDTKSLNCLPKPDKKFYASLLTQLAKYEVPELKSVEVSGQVEVGMQVHIVHHQAQAKVVKVDAGAPASIKKIYGQSTAETLTVADKAAAIPVAALDDI